MTFLERPPQPLMGRPSRSVTGPIPTYRTKVWRRVGLTGTPPISGDRPSLRKVGRDRRTHVSGPASLPLNFIAGLSPRAEGSKHRRDAGLPVQPSPSGYPQCRPSLSPLISPFTLFKTPASGTSVSNSNSIAILYKIDAVSQVFLTPAHSAKVETKSCDDSAELLKYVLLLSQSNTDTVGARCRLGLVSSA